MKDLPEALSSSMFCCGFSLQTICTSDIEIQSPGPGDWLSVRLPDHVDLDVEARSYSGNDPLKRKLLIAVDARVEKAAALGGIPFQANFNPSAAVNWELLGIRGRQDRTHARTTTEFQKAAVLLRSVSTTPKTL